MANVQLICNYRSATLNTLEESKFKEEFFAFLAANDDNTDALWLIVREESLEKVMRLVGLEDPSNDRKFSRKPFRGLVIVQI